MTAALVEVKQKLASNFDQSISESIDDVLTRDNLYLSEPTNSENLTARPFAIDCKNAFDGLAVQGQPEGGLRFGAQIKTGVRSLVTIGNTTENDTPPHGPISTSASGRGRPQSK